MNEELKKHIKEYPSSFDRTTVADRLVAEGVSVELYVEVKEQLWDRLIAIKLIKSPIEDHILDAKKALDKAVNLFMETW